MIDDRYDTLVGDGSTNAARLEVACGLPDFPQYSHNMLVWAVKEAEEVFIRNMVFPQSKACDRQKYENLTYIEGFGTFTLLNRYRRQQMWPVVWLDEYSSSSVMIRDSFLREIATVKRIFETFFSVYRESSSKNNSKFCLQVSVNFLMRYTTAATDILLALLQKYCFKQNLRASFYFKFGPDTEGDVFTEFISSFSRYYYADDDRLHIDFRQPLVVRTVCLKAHMPPSYIGQPADFVVNVPKTIIKLHGFSFVYTNENTNCESEIENVETDITNDMRELVADIIDAGKNEPPWPAFRSSLYKKVCRIEYVQEIKFRLRRAELNTARHFLWLRLHDIIQGRKEKLRQRILAEVFDPLICAAGTTSIDGSLLLPSFETLKITFVFSGPWIELSK